jgi:hypothetical protein
MTEIAIQRLSEAMGATGSMWESVSQREPKLTGRHICLPTGSLGSGAQSTWFTGGVHYIASFYPQVFLVIPLPAHHEACSSAVAFCRSIGLESIESGDYGPLKTSARINSLSSKLSLWVFRHSNVN